MELIILVLLSLAVMSPLFLVFKAGDVAGIYSPTVLIIALEIFGVLVQSIYISLEDSSFGMLMSIYPAFFLVLLFNIFYVLGFLAKFNGRGWPLLPVGFFANRWARLAIITLSLYLVYDFLSIFNIFSGGGFSAKRFMLEGDVEYSYSYLRIGADIVLVAGLVGFARYLEEKRLMLLVASVFSLIGAVLFYWFVSSRASLGIALLSYFMVYQFYNRKAIFSQFFRNAAIFFLVLVVFSVMASIRAEKGGEVNEAMIGDGVDAQVSQVFSGNYFFTINKAAKAVAEVDSLEEYKLGLTLLSPLYFFVPRTIWKDKPPVRFGEIFSREVFKRPGTSGIPPSFPVELYWNFGWLGVGGGALALGAICRSSVKSNYLERNKIDASINASIFSSFFIVPLMTNDFANGVISYLVAMVVAVIFKKKAWLHEKNSY